MTSVFCRTVLAVASLPAESASPSVTAVRHGFEVPGPGEGEGGGPPPLFDPPQAASIHATDSNGSRARGRRSIRVPILRFSAARGFFSRPAARGRRARSEEHTSELQSLAYLVCRLLLEKKKQNQT